MRCAVVQAWIISVLLGIVIFNERILVIRADEQKVAFREFIEVSICKQYNVSANGFSKLDNL